MLDFKMIEEMLSSDRPSSTESVAELIQQALKVFPVLKNAFVSGSPADKSEAKTEILLIFDKISQEAFKAFGSHDAVEFSLKIAPYLSAEDAGSYREVMEFLTLHADKIFMRQKSKNNCIIKNFKNKTKTLVC